MMNKMEMVNNKRVIAKKLDTVDFTDATVNVFTWLNGCWNETDGEHIQLDIMVEVFYGVEGDKQSVSITWKQVKTDNENKVLRQAFKATCELARWVWNRYGVAIANDDWLIID